MQRSEKVQFLITQVITIALVGVFIILKLIFTQKIAIYQEIIQIAIVVFLCEVLSYLVHLYSPARKIEELIPHIKENLDRKSSTVHEDLKTKTENLMRILSMYVEDKDIADILSSKLVLNIQQLLAKRVDCVFDQMLDDCTTLSSHYMAREALKQMLGGVVDQIEESKTWGLSVESIAPNPFKGSPPAYCDFVALATSRAKVFLGVSLMPPDWWLDTDLGLRQILDAQSERIKLLKSKKNFQLGTFSRIFVVRQDLIDSFKDYPFDEDHKSKEQRRQYVEEKLSKATGEDKDLLQFYSSAESQDDLKELRRRILLRDGCVKKVIKLHEDADILVGFRLADLQQYQEANDFVLIVDEKGYECVISSLGFEYTVKQNQWSSSKDLKEQLLKRYSGFLEGRLYYHRMGDNLVHGQEGRTEIGRRTKCWFDQTDEILWPADQTRRALFKLYHEELRKKWKKEAEEASGSV